MFTIMKRKFKLSFEIPDFRNKTHEEFMSDFRVFSAIVEEEHEKTGDADNTSFSIPGNTNVSKQLALVCSSNKAADTNESERDYFLAIKARKIVHEALGLKSDNDAKRLKTQFFEEEELHKELDRPIQTLPVHSFTDVNDSESGEIDFSEFSDEDKFKQYIDCTGFNLVECIAAYIRYKAGTIKTVSLLCHYPSIIYYIYKIELKYNITLTPGVIGCRFMNKFERFLRKNGLATNTIISMIRSLKTVLKWATLYGARLSVEFDNYKIKECDNRPKVSLTPEEICKIYYYDFSHLNISDKVKKSYGRVRDHFILSCFLGQRFSDTVRITKNNFNAFAQDTFKITQQKTGNNAVLEFHKIYGEYPVIAREILEKYDFNAPYTGTMATFNRHLHKICEYAGLTDNVEYEVKINGFIVKNSFPKYKLITSHTARRTFITNAVKRGLHTQMVKRASGHTSEKSFGQYVIWDEDIK